MPPRQSAALPSTRTGVSHTNDDFYDAHVHQLLCSLCKVRLLIMTIMMMMTTIMIMRMIFMISDVYFR